MLLLTLPLTRPRRVPSAAQAPSIVLAATSSLSLPVSVEVGDIADACSQAASVEVVLPIVGAPANDGDIGSPSLQFSEWVE